MSKEIKINQILANTKNHGGVRDIDKIKYIVVHWTANKTDLAFSNANYFKNNIVKTSAHYFVDDHAIYQSVKDNVIAWSVGGKKYLFSKGGKMYGVINNSNSINIELCCNNGDFLEETIDNAVFLIKKLMKKYNIPYTNIYRHYDVTGKVCPKPFVGDKNEKRWADFKTKCNECLDSDIPNCINVNSQKKYIKWLQTKLNKINIKGMDKLKVDGIYGNKTKEYVIAVWKYWGWKPSTGNGIGKKTITKLKQI